MIERCLALLMLGHVLAGNDWDIHDPATAGFAIQRGLLRTMPDTAIMYGQIAGGYVKADLTAVGIIVDEIFFAK